MRCKWKMLSSHSLGAICVFLALWGCDSAPKDSFAGAGDFDKTTACALDGMLLADYPGPKAQIRYEGVVQPEFFCDAMEMLNLYLNPEQKRRVVGVYVQDLGQTTWETPRGAWVDAKTAFYVIGSKRKGAMGPTFATFAQEAAAQKFAAEFGGKVFRFGEINTSMVKLDGGALHDQRM